jgi:AcrR family transcriptional regulator
MEDIVNRAPPTGTARVAHLRRGRPPREEAASRRQDRLEELSRAAAMVLAQQGVRAATMDALAEGLGVPKQVLYRYFPSKDELIHTILRRISALWRELQSRPWRGLGRNLRDVITLARANPSEFQILARHCALDPDLRHYFDDLHDGIVERTDKLLAGSSPRLASDDMLRGLCAQAVAGFLIDAVLWWLEHGEPTRDEDFFRWARQSLGTLYASWMPDARAVSPRSD